MRRWLVVLVILLSVPLARGAAGAAVRDDAHRVAEVAHWLSGSFTSAAQAKRDTTFLDIRLHIAPVWRERADGPWLYVEQAMGSRPDRPYRQRVYRLSAGADGGVVSAVYALPAPLRFAGAWRSRAPLAGLTPDSLSALEGCSVYLVRGADGHWSGGTRGTTCASAMNGAAYATSEVTLLRGRMVTLDRGYDAAGVQVWGSTKGGYEFVRER